MIVALLVQRARRRRVERALRESEERFRLMADTAPVLVWRADTANLCDFVNRPWLEFTGRTMEQELGNGWAESVWPEDLDRSVRTCVSAFDARQPFRMEFRLRRADGAYRWVLDTGVPRYGPDGSFAGYIGSCLDITERKASEDALRESQQRYTLATAAGAVGVWDWNLETSEVYVDPTLKSILGFDDAGITNRADDWGSRVHLDDVRDGDGAGAGVHRRPHRRLRSRASDDPQGWQRAMVPLARIVVETCGRHAAPHGRDESGHHRTQARRRGDSRTGSRPAGQRPGDSESGGTPDCGAGGRAVAARARSARRYQSATRRSGHRAQRSQAPGGCIAGREELQQDVSALQQRTIALAGNVRHLSHDLHPSILEHAGLVAALSAYCTEVAAVSTP